MKLMYENKDYDELVFELDKTSKFSNGQEILTKFRQQLVKSYFILLDACSSLIVSTDKSRELTEKLNGASDIIKSVIEDLDSRL